jgi:undecaprenyl pyrophosphate phosphatase UppP
MNFFYAIFLGLLQGATEFLPISSSAHLALVEKHFLVLKRAAWPLMLRCTWEPF